MLELSFETMMLAVVLVVLAGSLLGSTRTFLGGSAPQADAPASGSWRPANTSAQSGGTPTYLTAQSAGRTSGTSVMAALFVGGVAFLTTSVGMTIYKSPWAPDVTLRHMAAALHCDLAEQVGLASSRAGEPGYHIRNDRDRDGIACEVHADALGPIATNEVSASRLSTQPLGWSQSSDDASR